MMTDEEKLKGKIIIDAEITGYSVTLKFNDGTIFEYEASDGGYSVWNWAESEDKDSKENKENDEDLWERMTDDYMK